MLILVIVFASFFIAVVLVGVALSSAASKETKQTASRLEALAVPHIRTEGEAESLPTIRAEERLSTIPWIDELLRKADFSATLRLILYQAELDWNVGRLVLTAILVGLACGVLVNLRTGVFLLSLIVALGGGSLPFVYVLRRRSQRFEQMRQLLPEAMDLMTATLRAGHSLTSSMSIAAKESPDPVRKELRQCFDEQAYGLELRTALSNLEYRVPIPEISMIVTAVLIQSESGGNLAEILDKVAHLMRENFRLRRQIRVHTAQGRISGWILTIMPVVLGFLLYLINPQQMSLLWTHPLGRKLMYTAMAMIAAGGLMIRKIVRIRM